MNRSIYVALSCCAFIFLFSGCEEFGIGNKSELPDDIVGYELVIYNTKTISNPDGLNVSNRTVYFFEDRNTIIGQGTNNSGPLPTTRYSWSALVTSATLIMHYNGGMETYSFDWNEGVGDIERRQTFDYRGRLGNFATVETEGWYEIRKR